MSKYTEEQLIEAHKWSYGNIDKLDKEQKCGCFYCSRIFPSSEIKEYVDDLPVGTALCPYCSVDSILGENSGFPITKGFLDAMYEYWMC